MSDPLKDKRVKNCPDCKVVIMLGEAYTFYCSKHSRFGAIAQRPTKRAADGGESAEIDVNPYQSYKRYKNGVGKSRRR